MPTLTKHLPLLSARGLSKNYLRWNWLGSAKTEVAALHGIDLDLQAGQTLALTGPSGCGKSTLARCLAGLDFPTSGEILLQGAPAESPMALRKQVQLLFQEPGASLNPRFSVEEALLEPLSIQQASPSGDYVEKRLQQFGLPPTVRTRRTSQLSGGQKMRLALARALAALGDLDEPRFLILDESLGSLDLCARAQIINLLLDLKAKHALSYIVITHDLNLAAHLADEIARMAEGRIVERGSHLTRMVQTCRSHA